MCNATFHAQQIVHVDNSAQTFGTILGIVFVLLCTAGLAIKNIIYVSVLQRLHEFAQLRAIGATHRQIKSIVRKERTKIARPCILAGITLGLILNIVLPLPFHLFSSVVCFALSGIFIGVITALAFQSPAKMAASVSPIAAQQQISGSLRRCRAKYKLTPARIGWLYYSSNVKKTAYTFLSLLLSGILMFVVFSILNAINPQRLASQSYIENSDLYIQLNSTADEMSTYNLMKASPFTDDQKKKLYNISGVDKVYDLFMLDCMVTNSNGEKYELSIESILNPDTFETELAEGLMPDSRLQKDMLPVILNRQSPYYRELGVSLQVGAQLPCVIDTGRTKKDITLVVCGFVENSDTGVVIYTESENLKVLSEMNCTLAWYICLNSDKSEAATAEIKEIFGNDARVSVSVLTDDIKALEQYFHNAKIILIVLTVLISLFSFVNLLNTCITNSITRKHDYALMESIGMTKSQLQKTQRTENLIYLIGSFAGSCILGIPFGKIICTKISKLPGLSYFEYHFPIVFVFLYFAVVILVSCIVSLYQRKSLQQQSVIERIQTTD